MVWWSGLACILLMARLAALGIPGSGSSDAASSWRLVAPPPATSLGMATVTGPDGRIYAIGGRRELGGGVANVFEAYTPTTDAWTELAPLPTPRLGVTMVAGPDGRVYAVGGYVSGGDFDRYVTTVEAYSPATDRWSEVAPLPSPRAGGAAVVGADGRIYVIGGAFGGGLAGLASIVAYDSVTGVWAEAGGLPDARTSASAVTIDDRFYVVGGIPNAALAVLNTVIAYAPASGDWTAAGAIPSPFVSGFGPSHAGSAGAGLGSAVAPPRGPIYALATQWRPATGAYSNTLVAYDPTTRQSVSGPGLPVPLINPALAIDDTGQLYAIGVTADERTGVTEVLTSPPTPPPAAPCRFVLGFQTLHDALPDVVGDCLDNEQPSGPEGTTGDDLQWTANGQLVWRQADNVTAFTDGYRTWLDGPFGIQTRLNTQRFPWEDNPGYLPVVQ